jgi:uncharacterized protein YnzC (UPF0291/DUF896 family)
MRKLLTLVVMMVIAVAAMAQSTNKISYQAVIRDSHNRLVVNKPVSVTVTITYGNEHYSETLSGNTNANGLLSLEIGGETGFDAIDWRNALITTSTTIGNETVEDQVHVTAVPFALSANYATDINPNAPTVVAIYNDMQSLSNRIVADSNSLILFEQKMKADSAIMKGLFDANINAINNLQNADASLSQRIVADSNNLVNFKAKEKADSLALGTLIDANTGKINTLAAKEKADSLALSTLIDANTGKINTLAAKEKADSLALGQRLDAIESADYITKDVNTLTYYTTTSILENTYATKEAVEQLSSQVNTMLSNLNNRIDSVINVMNNLPTKMVEERDTVQTAGQTQFTLAHEARTDCIVRIYINGVMVGGNHNGVVTVANSNNQATVTYVPAQNGNYALKANDVVTFVYWLMEANSNSTAIIPGGN